MTIQGTLAHGAIVPDQPLSWPEGTRVEVVVKTVEESLREQPAFLDLLEFAGCMPDMPADFAAQHDHSIHGTPNAAKPQMANAQIPKS